VGRKELKKFAPTRWGKKVNFSPPEMKLIRFRNWLPLPSFLKGLAFAYI